MTVLLLNALITRIPVKYLVQAPTTIVTRGLSCEGMKREEVGKNGDKTGDFPPVNLMSESIEDTD